MSRRATPTPAGMISGIRMKDHLVFRGVLKSDADKTRNQYLKLMKENYAVVADPGPARTSQVLEESSRCTKH